MRKVSEMMQESRANSYLFGGNAPYVEELYEAYLDNPGSVPDRWRANTTRRVRSWRRRGRPSPRSLYERVLQSSVT